MVEQVVTESGKEFQIAGTGRPKAPRAEHWNRVGDENLSTADASFISTLETE